MRYESEVEIESQTLGGVQFTIAKMSFGRRIELMRRVRALTQQLEFFQAGKETHEEIEASLISAEIDRLYLEWGLVRVSGLEIDGAPADREMVSSAGPEQFCREVISAVKVHCGLSEEERKN